MSTNDQIINNKREWSAAQIILWSGIVVAVLDGIAGIIFFHIRLNFSPSKFMQWIASAIEGPSAFTAGSSAIIEGVVIHLLSSIIMAALYYLAYQSSRIIRGNTVISGIIYGFGIWIVMNLIVFPLSNVPPAPFVLFNALISITWHIVLVGLPIAIITNSHSKKSYNN